MPLIDCVCDFSRDFALFKALAVEIFLCLRRHSSLLYTTLRCIQQPDTSKTGHKTLEQHFEQSCFYQNTSGGGSATPTPSGEGGAATGSAPKFADDVQARAMFVEMLDRAQATSNFMMLDIAHQIAKARDAGTEGGYKYVTDALQSVADAWNTRMADA